MVETKEKGQRKPVGVVVSAGKMQNTVKVRIPGQTFNKHLRKVCSLVLDMGASGRRIILQACSTSAFLAL